MKSFKVQDVFSWRQAAFIGGMHILAVLALFYISMIGFLMLLGLHFLTGCIGISVGYHRLISHRAISSGHAMTAFMALCGALAFQGGPITWARFHRAHHRFTDRAGDPHAASRAFWWSHIGWAFYKGPNGFRPREMQGMVFDLNANPTISFIERHHVAINITFAAVIALLFGPGVMLVAVPLRIVFVWHHTWLINSIAHGVLPFQSRQDSVVNSAPRNLTILALTNYGEGFHKTHHENPRSQCFSPDRPSLDLGYMIIRAMSLLKLLPNQSRNSSFSKEENNLV